MNSIGTAFLRLGDAAWLMKRHRRRLGNWPNPILPRDFNDWIYRRLILKPSPLHAQLCCKLGQRSYIAERIGPEASLPLLGVWGDIASLAGDWDSLPPSFMLKPTHGSSWHRAVPDKAAADRTAILAEAADWLGRSYYRASREIGYRDVVPRLIAEPLLPPAPRFSAPWEYSFYCFDARPALLMARTCTLDGKKVQGFLDMERNPLPIKRPSRRVESQPMPPSDAAWARMLAHTGPLSRGVDFVRVDFFVDGDAVWAGEITPYPGGGRQDLEPRSWIDWLGDVWKATQQGQPWPDPPSGARPP
jgi:hypothetical protein